jgi:DNA-binding response OmpR family regulator
LDDTAIRPLVLIVDDELLIREALSDFLTTCGYETLTAAAGEDALELYDTRNVAAIVTDIHMGGMDGCVLISAVRGRGESVPIIAMSGGRLGEDVLCVATRLGADATLAKPFRPRALEGLLEKLLDRAA